MGGGALERSKGATEIRSPKYFFEIDMNLQVSRTQPKQNIFLGKLAITKETQANKIVTPCRSSKMSQPEQEIPETDSTNRKLPPVPKMRAGEKLIEVVS